MDLVSLHSHFYRLSSSSRQLLSELLPYLPSHLLPQPIPLLTARAVCQELLIDHSPSQRIQQLI